MAKARTPRSGREKGSIDELPSGALRVRVYAGVDPVTKRRHDLIEVADREPRDSAPPDPTQVEVDRASVVLDAAVYEVGDDGLQSDDEHLSRVSRWADDDAAMRAKTEHDEETHDDGR